MNEMNENNGNITITCIQDDETEIKNNLNSLNLDQISSEYDNEEDSNELVSDIMFDENAKIKYKNSLINFDEQFTEEYLKNLIKQSPCNINQINTNFILSSTIENDNSTSLHEIVENNYQLSKVDNIPSTPSFEIPFKTADELINVFSKRLFKVAIKSEVRSMIKHIVKRILKENNKINLSQCEASKSVHLELDGKPMLESTSEIIDQKEEEQLADSDILVVETQNKEDIINNHNYAKVLCDDLDKSAENVNKLDISTESYCNFDHQSSYFTNDNYIERSSEYRSTPTFRAIATSPINLPADTSGFSNKTLFRSLNCMSRQHKSKINQNLNSKSKLTSSSLFHRLFNRDKSKSKNSAPAFYTKTYSKENSNLSLDKFNIHSNQTSPRQCFYDEIKRNNIRDNYLAPLGSLSAESWCHIYLTTNKKYMESSTYRTSSVNCPNSFSTLSNNQSENASQSDKNQTVSTMNNAVYIVD